MNDLTPLFPAPRLRVRGLSKRYGSAQALADADFEIRPGEIMALLGENGAGKSTLVKVISGLVQPDAGSIEIDGVPTTLHPSARSQAAGVAVVHQEYSSIPTLSVAENFVIGQADVPRLWLPGRLKARARELLALVGLEHIDPGMPAERLSVAELQLLEIAKVLARDAQILIFDEPTAALADREIERVLKVITRLAREGRSIVYITHRLPEVFQIADRVTVFRNGRSHPPVAVQGLDVDAVITMMLGRELEAMFPARRPVGSEVLLQVEQLRVPGLAQPLSFSVRRGEIIGLTGQLGSGVSVVVRALAGMLPPSGGRAELCGRALALQTRASALAGGVAYCSADRKKDGIFAERSILENLSSPWIGKAARFGWISPARELAQAESIARQFTVDVKRLGSGVGTLSGGNQQKVAVGKWLGSGPSLLVLEEPTRGVDVGSRSEIYQRLRELCATGLGIVVASSDTAEIAGISDTIMTFYRGRVTACRPRDQWNEDSLVREVMHQEGAA